MKRVSLMAVCLMFSIGISFGQADSSVLPQNSQDFIDQNFGSETVESAEKENKWFSWDKNEMYEVHLTNGIKMDFNKEGEVTEIDSRDNAPIPEEAIPETIRSYVQSNYSDADIISWEKDNDEQEVELSDGIDLEFDLNGEFLKVD